MERPSFSANIRPLFTEEDIYSMKNIGGFDLSSLEDVRANAAKIYLRLSSKTMPLNRPWRDNQINMFKKWMNTGMTP